jgi:hypothetical protein
MVRAAEKIAFKGLIGLLQSPCHLQSTDWIGYDISHCRKFPMS